MPSLRASGSNHSSSSSFSIPSPSSSSSSASSPVSPYWRQQEKPGKRLTRLRKLRYLTDLEAGLSPSSASVSPFPSTSEVSSPDTALPLPESGDGRLSVSSGRRLPSPGDSERKVQRLSASDFNYEIGSSMGFKTVERRTIHVQALSYEPSLENTRQVVHVQDNVHKVHHVDKPDGISRSAPSVLSSTGDCLIPSSEYVEEPHNWYPKEEAVSFDGPLTSPSLPGTILPSPEHSPLHSPRRIVVASNSKSENGSSSGVNTKVPPESSGVTHEVSNNMVVHRLPLPPAAVAVSRPSTVSHQPAATPKLSPMARSWKKQNLVGSGTYGRVYRAFNSQSGATCAMKEVSLVPEDPKSAECIKALEQEIKSLGRFKHPNIVRCYGSEIVGENFCIYLEFVHPGSITKVIQDSGGSLPEAVVCNYTRHIVSGLVYLHSKYIVHRDIKGANLLVDHHGVVKLADFGLAKHMSGQAAPFSLKGSPYWMAPEVLRQNETGCNFAVDIWSLGCTIIEMITGKPPWGNLPGAAAMFNVMHNKIPPIPGNLSSEGKDFLRCCLQTNPAERSTAEELLAHPFLNSLHQEISSYHRTLLDLKKLNIAPNIKEKASRANDTMSKFPRQGTKEKEASQG